MTQEAIRQIREAYVSLVDRERPPSIPELCREHGADDEADIKFVRRAFNKENWEGHRQKRKHKINTALEKREDALISRLADDMIAKRTEYIQRAIFEVDDMLPAMLEELKARVESGFMDDKALVSAIKLLMESRKATMETIQKEFQDADRGAGKGKQTMTGHEMMRDLGLLSKIIDAIEGKVTSDIMDANLEQEHRQNDALRILDAEVIGEG